MTNREIAQAILDRVEDILLVSILTLDEKGSYLSDTERATWLLNEVKYIVEELKDDHALTTSKAYDYH